MTRDDHAARAREPLEPHRRTGQVRTRKRTLLDVSRETQRTRLAGNLDHTMHVVGNDREERRFLKSAPAAGTRPRWTTAGASRERVRGVDE